MTITQSLAGLPAFLLYFSLAMALLGLFIAVYVAVTPYKELTLIREGNQAAAISLGGAVVGFVLPLARAVTQSVSALDLVVWGLVALVVQVVVFFVVGKLVPRFAEAISDGTSLRGEVGDRNVLGAPPGGHAEGDETDGARPYDADAGGRTVGHAAPCVHRVGQSTPERGKRPTHGGGRERTAQRATEAAPRDAGWAAGARGRAACT